NRNRKKNQKRTKRTKKKKMKKKTMTKIKKRMKKTPKMTSRKMMVRKMKMTKKIMTSIKKMAKMNIKRRTVIQMRGIMVTITTQMNSIRCESVWDFCNYHNANNINGLSCFFRIWNLQVAYSKYNRICWRDN